MRYWKMVKQNVTETVKKIVRKKKVNKEYIKNE